MKRCMIAALLLLAAVPSQAATIAAQGSLADSYISDPANVASQYCSPCYGQYQTYQAFTVSGDFMLESLKLAVDWQYFWDGIYKATPITFTIQDATTNVLFSTIFTDTSLLTFPVVNGGYAGAATLNLEGIGLDVTSGDYYFSLFGGTDVYGFLTYRIDDGGIYQTDVIGAQPLSGHKRNAGSVFLISGTPLVAGAVPEPATWGMMIAGFAGIGASLRRRKVASTVRFA